MDMWAVLCSFLPGRSGFWEAGGGNWQLPEEEEAVRVWGLASMPGLILQWEWELGAGVSSENGRRPFTAGTGLCRLSSLHQRPRARLGRPFPLQSHPAIPTQRASWSSLSGTLFPIPPLSPEGSQTAVLGLHCHWLGGRVCDEQPYSSGDW